MQVFSTVIEVMICVKTFLQVLFFKEEYYIHGIIMLRILDLRRSHVT